MAEINDPRIIAVVQRLVANRGIGPRNTVGSLFRKVDGKWLWFAYTLEDELRPEGVKVYGATCIEAGIYNMAVTYSPHFKRDTVAIAPRFEAKTSFAGLRMHGGNTEADTLGCILIAYKVNPQFTAIQSSAEKAWTSWVEARGGGLLLVENKQLEGMDYVAKFGAFPNKLL